MAIDHWPIEAENYPLKFKKQEHVQRKNMSNPDSTKIRIGDQVHRKGKSRNPLKLFKRISWPLGFRARA